MNPRALRKLVIVGGGTAGWMAALPLAQQLCRGAGDQPPAEVVLVESAEIGTIGVGEATLPTIREYNQRVGLDTAEFIRQTQASFKLGIAFQDWSRLGERFFHGFGDFGPPIAGRSPHHHWLRLQQGGGLPPLQAFSTASVMAAAQRFTPPEGDRPSAANAYSYAFHFDAGLYAAYLRTQAQRAGAQRVEGTIVDVELRPDDGFVAALKLADGRRIDGDLFIDCSGLRALLIEGAMHAGYDDWRAWLPCDSALAVPSVRTEPLAPFTVSHARAAGWTWRIPLQHRTGNGHVYCSGHTSDDEAARVLLQGLDGAALDVLRPVRFTTGRRRQAWVKNVVAIGLSAGFLEPLESTSIHLILDNIFSLLYLLPDRDCAPALAAEFNRKVAAQYEAVRDFIVLHYKLTQRTDTAFWRACAAMPVPDALAQQIELFRETARVRVSDPNGFGEASWLAIYLGMGLRPRRWDPAADLLDETSLRTHFSRLQQAIANTVAAMPLHADFVARHVAAPPLR